MKNGWEYLKELHGPESANVTLPDLIHKVQRDVLNELRSMCGCWDGCQGCDNAKKLAATIGKDTVE